MNQEIKQKLKQAAETAWEQDQKINPSPVNPHAYVYGYKAGAQTILENPEEWDLVRYEDYLKHSKRTLSENERYREALDKITQVSGNPISSGIAKEALKQEVNND